jgi:Trk-type K+ transport system membrane component
MREEIGMRAHALLLSCMMSLGRCGVVPVLCKIASMASKPNSRNGSNGHHDANDIVLALG